MRNYAVYALMYLLGLRVGEVHGLNLSDLDLEKKKVTVMGKGKRKRTLDLTDAAMAVISHWIAVRTFFRNSDHSQALFLSKKGNRLAIRTMEDNFKKLVRKANLKTGFPVTCHTLRHTFASHLNEHQVDLLVIQDLLGHSSPRSTEIYIHTPIRLIRQALERLPAVIHVRNLMATGQIKLTFHTGYSQRE
ncbi:tyrosine-type recombinase/integrase [candidate division CSSED10-310 bacterium]|uniref:Tyrosine-type recombinase/integrase n=1 Tax=candidate division CSSED10-310 bacterium TaxID=2855610 RepID=A0ABV6YVV1_UNCC1